MVFQSKISISNPSVQSIFCCQEFCLHASNWTDGFFIPHGCKQFIVQMDQMKLFRSHSWNLKLNSINSVSKVDYVREIHEVRDTWCTGLKGRMHAWIRWIRWCCLSQKESWQQKLMPVSKQLNRWIRWGYKSLKIRMNYRNQSIQPVILFKNHESITRFDGEIYDRWNRRHYASLESQGRLDLSIWLLKKLKSQT